MKKLIWSALVLVLVVAGAIQVVHKHPGLIPQPDLSAATAAHSAHNSVSWTLEDMTGFLEKRGYTIQRPKDTMSLVVIANQPRKNIQIMFFREGSSIDSVEFSWKRPGYSIEGNGFTKADQEVLRSEWSEIADVAARIADDESVAEQLNSKFHDELRADGIGMLFIQATRDGLDFPSGHCEFEFQQQDGSLKLTITFGSQ